MSKTVINKAGYSVFEDSGNLYHRWVIGKKYPKMDLNGFDVHHVNHDKQDNRKENLILLKPDDHRHLHEYEKMRNFWIKLILFFAVVLQIFFYLQFYFNQTINIPSAILFTSVIIILCIELLTHFFERTIRRPKKKNTPEAKPLEGIEPPTPSLQN